MPEVVVATPDVDGNPRNWDDVFPIWKQNAEQREWQIINSVLESVAMNNRFGGLSLEDLRKRIMEGILSQVETELKNTLESLQALPNPEINGIGYIDNQDDITEEHKAILKKRDAYWAEYGRWSYYVDAVINSVYHTYREYK